MTEHGVREDETSDEFWDGAVRILQRRRGYRFSIDAALLAWFTAPATGRALDLGAGCGIVSVLLVRSHKCERIVALEIQDALADLAHRNAALNGLSGRMHVVRGDVRQAAALFPGCPFSVVVANPPYRGTAAGKRSPVPEIEQAKHEILATLRDFVTAGARCLAQGGSLFMIHLASREADVLGAMEKEGCRCVAVRRVLPREGSPARFVLFHGVRGGAASAVTQLPPLVLHGGEGKYTPEVEAILRPGSGGPGSGEDKATD